MAKYIVKQGTPYRVGFSMLPNRKKPQLVIETGNTCRTYGQFKDEQAADEWFGMLCALLSVKGEKEIASDD